MPRTGRPPIKPKDRRTGFITLRLTDAERQLIEQAADDNGKRATTWAREALLEMAAAKAR